MKRGALLSIESTIPPGTMTGLVIPAVRRTGVSNLERTIPGALPGGSCQDGCRAISGLRPDTRSYMRGRPMWLPISQPDRGGHYPQDLVNKRRSPRPRRMRTDAQIAFANEVALLCEGRSGRPEVRVSEHLPFRDMHIPGSGVGGWLAKGPLVTAECCEARTKRGHPAARRVNDHMPIHGRTGPEGFS